MKEVFIASAVRTPIGSFGGQLSSFSATELGSLAIKGALEKAGVESTAVEEVFMGNVCSAGLGQAPARQAALGAGVPENTPCTTVNKVCASGMKSIMLAAQQIQLGLVDIAVAGGMESMSNIPYYLSDMRWGSKYGARQVIDGLEYDGLRDAYNKAAMGNYADATAKELNISREEQDRFAIQSYKRSEASTTAGQMSEEIIPVSIPQRKGDPIVMTQDEEYGRVKFDKIPGLRPAFNKDGTVTAANASTINDGAAALVLVSQEKLSELGLTPIARILSYADAAHEPQWFSTAPTIAAPKAAKRAGMDLSDIDFFEVNEAFAVVTLAFNKVLNISEEKVNAFGGACSLGHPLGASGARIMVTLLNVLKNKNAKNGLATLCNGGGGASAIVVERL
jgi:acetyl-CoA C-acetyltransferase